jgi:hypothetical protein
MLAFEVTTTYELLDINVSEKHTFSIYRDAIDSIKRYIIYLVANLDKTAYTKVVSLVK